MFKVEKKKMDKEKCLDFCLEKRFLGNYKYFTQVMLHEDDIEVYIRYLKRCEKSGQEYILTYIETNEEYKILGGFTNFELKGVNNSLARDFFTLEKDCTETVKDYFADWQERCEYYILSSNFRRMKNTALSF